MNSSVRTENVVHVAYMYMKAFGYNLLRCWGFITINSSSKSDQYDVDTT